VVYECHACSKQYSLKQIEGRVEEIEKMITDFEKLDTYQSIKNSFFMLRKVMSFDHPFFAEAIDKVYHSTINSLATIEDSGTHNKLLETAYILMKEQIKGIPTWYKLEVGEENNIRFFLKYAHFGKLCYNVGRVQKALEYTEKAHELAKACHLKNKYAEVAELEQRYEELRIEASMAKTKSFQNC
jgi:tetratricopeptide (TPR) repeat protein